MGKVRTVNVVPRFISAALIAFAVHVTASASPLFDSEDTVTITIEAPFKTLFGELLYEDTYVDGRLIGAGGVPLEVKLKPRGKSRRNPETCNFPPLTVNFRKDDVGDTVFAGQNKLKLVTHCQDRKESWQIYYRQEYHIYKVYNLLTDESFRVRPAMVTYVDTDGKRQTVTRFGFFIEDADELAERVGLERYKVEKFKSDMLDPVKASRFAIFQYFIANLDWAVMGGPAGENCCHNSKPFINELNVVTSVPYDFDFAGVINARYATPPDGVRVNNVRTRLYRGLCKHNATVPAAVALLNDRRDAITELYMSSPYLEERDAEKALKFYDGFFKTVNNPRDYDRRIIQKCRS